MIIAWWIDGEDVPIERVAYSSPGLPTAVQLIPWPTAWAVRATHITIEVR